MSNYHAPNNSMKSKEEKEKPEVQKVTSSEVRKRKKPVSRRIGEVFLAEDGRTVGHYVLFDVAIPAIKTLVFDVFTQGLERSMFGEGRSTARPSRSSYGSAFKSSRNTTPMSNRARATHDFDEIILQDRGEAEMVLMKLSDLIDAYNQASVADLYALVGQSSSFTDDSWGWTDMRYASVLRLSRGNGYVLDLPKPIPLEGYTR